MQFQQDYLSFSVDPSTGTFSIRDEREGGFSLTSARIELSGWFRGRYFRDLLLLEQNSVTYEKMEGTGIQKVCFAPKSSVVGLDITIEFHLEPAPVLRWQVFIANRLSHPVWLERLTLLGGRKHHPGASLELQCAKEDIGFFCNGWQSWSFAGFCSRSQSPMRSRLGLAQEPMIIDAGLTKTDRRNWISDMYAVVLDRTNHKGAVLGFLSQKEQFGHVSLALQDAPQLTMWVDLDGTRLDPKQTMQTDPAVFIPIEGTHSEVLQPYLDLVAEEHVIRINEAAPTGWCSWYQYYQKIDEEIIRKNLRMLDAQREQLPVELVQIDDGFQEEVGDWLTFRPGFKHGMRPISDAIRDKGFLPGVWLAPFIVHRRSTLFREHPDWILRKVNGRPVNAGFGWNSLGTALDMTLPQAQDYVREVIQTAVQDWKFPYLKLDFLYATALKGVYHDRTKTRAQVLRQGMQLIRETAGQDTYLVGCGMPLGPALGIVDAMRIGPDVNGAWLPKIFGIGFPFKNEPSVPSARNSARNILTRANMHDRWWVNDPDCLLVRDQSKLTLEEIQSLATIIALSGGSLIFSDDLTALSKERMHLAQKLIPPIGSRLQVLDWLDQQNPCKLKVDLHGAAGDWYLIAYVNWTDRAQQIDLRCEAFSIPEGEYWVSDFWNELVWQNEEKGTLGKRMIPAHACVFLAVRPRLQYAMQYIGSNIHCSQGIELRDWSAAKDGAICVLDVQRKASGNIYVACQGALQAVSSLGEKMLVTEISDGVHAIRVCVDGPTKYSIINK